ncbi:MAG: oligosaccharide flippase family protein [Anaerolineales bacterium]|nr:oligosaccharide flippase family protein [Anaerolineales bacterium]
MITKKQFSKNLGVNVINFAVNFASGLLVAPFLIHHLGISAFGIVGVSMSVVGFMTIVSTSLNQANNRFVSMNMVSGDKQTTISVITTTFILYGISILVFLPILAFISINSGRIFNISPNTVPAASFLFLLMGLGQVLIMLNAVIVSPLFAKNRLDIIQSLNILRNVLDIVFLFISVTYISNSLISVGAAYLGAIVLAITAAIVYFRKFLPYYKFRFHDFNKNKARDIFKLSGWTAVSAVGMLMFLQTDVVLINIFLGAEEAGKYAVAGQWRLLLISVATILSVVTAPIILLKYSENRLNELKDFLYKAVKYQGIYTAVPTALLVVYADTILSLWLGNDFIELSILLRAMIFHLAFSQAIRPLYAVGTAFNKAKLPGIATLSLGLSHVVLSIGLLKFTNFGVLGVIVSGTFFTVLLNAVFLPVYVARYLKVSPTQLYRNIAPALFTEVLLIFFGFTLRLLFKPTSWVALFFASIIVAVLGLFCVYWILLDPKEKAEIKILLGKAKHIVPLWR